MGEQVNTVTIDSNEYQSLLKDRDVLSALYAGGVQDWDWYEASLEDAGLA